MSKKRRNKKIEMIKIENESNYDDP